MVRISLLALLALATSCLALPNDTAEKQGVPASTVEAASPKASGQAQPTGGENVDKMEKILQAIDILDEKFKAKTKKMAETEKNVPGIVNKIMAKVYASANTTATLPLGIGDKESSDDATGSSDNEKDLENMILEALDLKKQFEAAREE